MYHDPYFSKICSQAISLLDTKIVANDVRHMFVTLWQDFINSPSTKLIDLTRQEMNAYAANLMLNSIAAWDIAYDDSAKNRAFNTTFYLWPKFVEFVRESHLDATSKGEWDPITIDLSLLSLT